MNIQESFAEIIRGKSEMTEEFRTSISELLANKEIEKKEIAEEDELQDLDLGLDDAEPVTEDENLNVDNSDNMNNADNMSDDSNADESMEEGMLGAALGAAAGAALGGGALGAAAGAAAGDYVTGD